MNSEIQDDTSPRVTVQGVLRAFPFFIAFFFGPAILWFIASRTRDAHPPLAIAFFPFFVIGYFGVWALFVRLGTMRRRRGWSLPFEKRWHVGATSGSDAILFHTAISASGCLVVGCVMRNIVPDGFPWIALAMIFVFPIRDARGGYGMFAVLIAVVEFLLMLLPVRLVYLYGANPVTVAAAIIAFLLGGACLFMTLVRKSEDAWLHEQERAAAVSDDIPEGGEPCDDH